MRVLYFLLLFLLPAVNVIAENGYDLWLRYKPVENQALLASYRQQVTAICTFGQSPTLAVANLELKTALPALLQTRITQTEKILQHGTLVIGTIHSKGFPEMKGLEQDLHHLGKEGFLLTSRIINGKRSFVITGNSDIGVLYGVFHFLRLIQTNQPIINWNTSSAPLISLRLLNHWDNLNRTVERGYAGFSIWNWHTLPGYIDKRYIDYARANASIGINGTVLTNVNANATILSRPYLEKVAALAGAFRPYGLKVYLTARFSAPIESGGLKTADPLNDSVRNWWMQKAKEIYSLIPDFGGFLVKANSEGQPGPQDYGRTHADGANMLADAVAPYNGIVMWRAFVYSQQSDDRFKQAYEEFKPLDGKFRKNVMVQVKNGPIDFQPREPFSPLFGAMPNTPLMMEFQLTQEYLGQGTHLVFEAPMFKEVLESDTYYKGKGSTVAKVVDGSLDQFQLNGMAGVSNIGNDINWCGHLFGQANWYTLGRLSWNYNLTSEQIANEWIRQTFSNNALCVAPIKRIMLQSHEVMVNYMVPIGLTHIMYNGHHYGPMPWGNSFSRKDWNPVYYHRADEAGIGFDRTATGTNALAQYAGPVQKQFSDSTTCPDDYLLWFHHVSWNHRMHSGRSLWNELCYRYYTAVDSMKAMQQQWNKIKPYIDAERFDHVQQLLKIQVADAIWWRNACLLYFQTFSKMPIPATYEQPDKTLEFYKALKYRFVPGNSSQD